MAMIETIDSRRRVPFDRPALRLGAGGAARLM